MYFNHAFRKSFVPKITGGAPGAVDLLSSAGDPTTDLLVNGAGTIGLFDKNNLSIDPTLPTSKPFYIAQASYYTQDKITPFLGGYQESVKSKMINPAYVHRVIRFNGATPANQVRVLKACDMECGKNYNLRMDLKGAPALRFLSHNVYKTLSAYTGCCTDDCSATCTGALVDPTTVMINWATQIINDPILSQFLEVTEIVDYEGNSVAEMGVGGITTQAQFLSAIAAYSPTNPWDPNSATASADFSAMKITVAYADTKFGACTFTPTDYYGVQPLNTLFSMVDESGDPCNVQCFDVTGQYKPDGTFTANNASFTSVTGPGVTGSQAEGLLDSVIRELILDGRYRQEAYPDSSRIESYRMREIEANPLIQTLTAQAATGNVIYDRLIVLHSVPRFNNPTGTFDNDQYMLVFHVPTNASTTVLSDYIINSANAAQGANTIALETY